MILLAFILLGACDSSPSDSAGETAEAADAAGSCSALCTASGFGAGTAEEYEHEVNCTCSGGDGTGAVEAAACTTTCTDLGWTTGTTYASTGGAVDACQCSDE